MSTAFGPAVESRGLLRLLLLERSADEARHIRGLLEAEPGFRVEQAEGIAEAAALLAAHTADVLLIDQGLWAEQGEDLGACLREERPDVAVVLLTDGARECEASAVLKLGARDSIDRGSLEQGQLVERIIGAVEESRMLRRRETMVRWLEREARTDHLTGLFNRRAFDDRLRELCANARPGGRMITIVLMDITGTQVVNEVHGHEAGDAMIRRAAQGVIRSIRASDFAARVGGDDFGIIVGEADLEAGRRVARRIAHEIERLNGDEWADEIPVSVVFGVASGSGCEAGELFAAGEEQLAVHKTSRPAWPALPAREESGGPSVA